MVDSRQAESSSLPVPTELTGSVRPQITLSGLLALLTLTSLCFALVYVAPGCRAGLLVFGLPVAMRVIVSWASQQLRGRRLTWGELLLVTIGSSVAVFIWFLNFAAVLVVVSFSATLVPDPLYATLVSLVPATLAGAFMLWLSWNLPEELAGLTKQLKAKP